MPVESPSRFVEQLRILVRHQVDFIVVGGVSAVLHGAPVMTLDLDVVHSKDPDNLGRLAKALEELGAIYRDPAGRRIVPDEAKLKDIKINLLDTKLGGLDLLASIGEEQTYEDLVPHSAVFELEGFRLRVLDLDVLIRAKEIANREKDRAMLPILRRTLELQRRGDEEPEDRPGATGLKPRAGN